MSYPACHGTDNSEMLAILEGLRERRIPSKMKKAIRKESKTEVKQKSKIRNKRSKNVKRDKGDTQTST